MQRLTDGQPALQLDDDDYRGLRFVYDDYARRFYSEIQNECGQGRLM